MKNEIVFTVKRSRSGWYVACSCGALYMDDVPEAEVGMLVRIHMNASHPEHGDSGGRSDA